MLLVISTILLLALVSLLLVPTALLLLQVLASLMPRAKAAMPQGKRPTIAVLVPAHNESTGIRRTINALRPELQHCDRLLVVADNCSDDTAVVAARAGAEVVERHDTTHRGKGYALDFGLRHLAEVPPQVVVIVDADCLAYPGAIERVARICAVRGRPVQALYLMSAPPAAGPMAPIAEFAWLVKNLARPLGYLRLGLPCQLMGTGMAFQWADIRQLPLASGHIVEDLKMGMELAAGGRAPLFCADALVTSTFPASQEGTKSQRTRWEHGHLGMILSDAPRYLARALRNANGSLLALALDMCVPPLALLTLAVAAAFCLALGHYVLWGQPLVLVAAGFTLACLALAVLLAWARFGRDVLSLGRLAYAPFYALRKIPLYARFLVSRQADWVRSKRDAGPWMMWKDRWTTIVQKIEIVDSPSDESTLLASLTDSAQPQVLGFVNAHAMNYCAADAAFFEALSSADVLLRDGSGMAIMYRRARREPGLNMNGTDFIPKILAAFRGRGVAFWGTQDPYLSQAIVNGERQFGIRVVSREDGFKDFAHYLRLARQSAPDLIVLGMGIPKQEQLARELKGKVAGSPLIVCGGAVLDFLGDKVDRAPPLIRNAGLEWGYRLVREPRRLFHRYVLGNPAFLIKVLAWTRDRRHG